MYIMKILEILMIVRMHVKEIKQTDILFGIVNLVNNSYLFQLTPDNFQKPKDMGSNTNILTKNMIGRVEEKETGPKFYSNLVQIRKEYE